MLTTVNSNIFYIMTADCYRLLTTVNTQRETEKMENTEKTILRVLIDQLPNDPHVNHEAPGMLDTIGCWLFRLCLGAMNIACVYVIWLVLTRQW